MSGRRISFDGWVLDRDSGDLTRNGTRQRLQELPLKILDLLVANPGAVVTREQLIAHLWPNGVVEFDTGLNTAIRKLRVALGDVADTPRYIETLPRRGYRFLGTIDSPTDSTTCTAPTGAGDPLSVPTVAAETVPRQPGDSERPIAETEPVAVLSGWRRVLPVAVAVAAVMGAGLVVATLVHRGRGAPSTVAIRVVLAEFANRTGQPVFDGTLRQALSIDLGQSPVIRVLPDESVRATLQLMNREPGEPLAQAVALEVCKRRALEAVLEGAILRLATNYVITLEALDCRNGERLALTSSRVGSEQGTLDALSRAATEMRAKLGESQTSIGTSSRPLREVTTSSLEALQAFTVAVNTMRHAADISAAIPLFEQAIERDPAFASAYDYLGVLYMQLGEMERAADFQSKAYALRDRVSEKERYHIVAFYHYIVTGDLDREIATYQLWSARYPEEWLPLGDLAQIFAFFLGDYSKALEFATRCEKLEAEQPYCAETMAAAYLAMNEPAQARTVLEKALARKLDNPMLHATMYRVARFQNDTALAEAQRSWSARQPIQDGLGWMFGDELGQRGQLNLLQQSLRAEARELSEAGLNDAAADDLARLTLIEAELGDTQAVAADSGATLALSRGRARLPQLAIAFALVGDNTRAKALLEELQRRFPHDFFARRVYIPLARALMLANDGNTDEALRVLDPVRRFDFGRRWYFMPLYVRGLVFLKNGDTTAARGEFQKIIDHRGISVFALEWVLAHLGKARALAQADEREMRRAAYQQFFNLWEGADPDIPILQQAWREYAQPAELASQASYSGAARTDGRANNRRE